MKLGAIDAEALRPLEKQAHGHGPRKRQKSSLFRLRFLWLPPDVIFKAKMHQIRFRLGLRAPIAGVKGHTSKGKEGREREKGEGKG